MVDSEANDRYMSLIVLARRTLLDEEKRSAYDGELSERRVNAASRDEAKPMPLRADGVLVHSWAELEPALGDRPQQVLSLLQDGEIEAWLRWSLNQRQYANWVRNLAQRSRESATPLMEVEELLRLSTTPIVLCTSIDRKPIPMQWPRW